MISNRPKMKPKRPVSEGMGNRWGIMRSK